MRTLLIALVLAAAGVAPASAQESPEIGALLQRIATLWAGGDAAGIARHVAGTGLELELQGEPMVPIAGRQAAAALRRVFAGQETVSVVTTMTSRVQGAEDRAFGELDWQHRSNGSRFVEKNTVFVGLVREGSGWRVSQIRILP